MPGWRPAALKGKGSAHMDGYIGKGRSKGWRVRLSFLVGLAHWEMTSPCTGWPHKNHENRFRPSDSDVVTKGHATTAQVSAAMCANDSWVLNLIHRTMRRLSSRALAKNRPVFLDVRPVIAWPRVRICGSVGEVRWKGRTRCPVRNHCEFRVTVDY